jgi:hypothetical protein
MKQTQKNLENDFSKTTFQKTNTTEVLSIFLYE